MSNENLALTPSGLRSFNRWHLWLSLLLLLLLFLLPALFGIGPNSWKQCGAPAVSAAAPVVAAPAVEPPPAPMAVAPAPPPAPVVAAPAPAPALPAPPPAAKVFFAYDKYDLPGSATATLAPIVAYLKANDSAKALVSGFHDPRGDKGYNEELALNRARAVRTSLEKSGVNKDRIELAKPTETTGTGSNPEARRVEVSIAR